jgi:hypothetical protein
VLTSLSAPFLTTKSYIAYRLATPLILYLPVSFLFSMINLPFKVDFGAHFTYAGGFFLWAFTVYLGMAAVGLSTEFAVTILGPKFTGFFLVPLIIANVSYVPPPFAIMARTYRLLVLLPCLMSCNRGSTDTASPCRSTTSAASSAP